MATTRRTFVLTAACGAPLLAALACTGRRPPAGADTRAFVDELSRPVTPRHAPTRRVVSLAPNVTELLFAIGADDQLVAVDNYSDQPAGQVERVARVGSDYDPSLESIVRLDPDVVFTSLSANRRETVAALERLGVAVFVTDTRALSDLDRTFVNLGALTGHARQAAEQIVALRAGFETVKQRVSGAERPGVLVAVWDEPLYVAGRGTFTHDLIEMAGGTNVAADAVGFAKYPLERVLRAAPQIIVMPTHDPEVRGARAVAYWSRWKELPAVRNQRVHAMEDALIIRPGPRLPEGAAQLADFIHPERPRTTATGVPATVAPAARPAARP